ncbi:MAG: hypothetical protein QOC82_2754 [Frankiaceae bacterium]|jgi:hypothetical protein|nr:hypothetical protein [Frankiaceae bacterium]
MPGNNQSAPASKWAKAAQVVLFLAALALLGLHTDQSDLTDRGIKVQIDSTSLALLALMAVAILLPRLRSIKAGTVEAAFDAAARAGESAAAAAQPDDLTGLAAATAPAAAAGTPAESQSVAGALTAAIENPLVSIEASRRALAADLRELAAAVKLDQPPTEMAELGKQLKEQGALPDKAAAAITDLVNAIRQAKLAQGPLPPGVAVEVDTATQILRSVIRRAITEATTPASVPAIETAPATQAGATETAPTAGAPAAAEGPDAC